MDGFWSRIEACGIELNPYQGAVSQTIVVARTDDEAQQRYEPHFEYSSKHTFDDFLGWTEAPGWRTERGIRERAAQTMRELADPQPPRIPTWQERLDSGSLAAGSPETVTEQLEHLVKSLHAGHLIGVFHLGDMTHDLTLRSTRLFAEQVIPRLRHLWEDHEDHWSPRPIATQQSRAPRRDLAGVN